MHDSAVNSDAPPFPLFCWQQWLTIPSGCWERVQLLTRPCHQRLLGMLLQGGGGKGDQREGKGKGNNKAVPLYLFFSRMEAPTNLK